jgi:hypothetical protein
MLRSRRLPSRPRSIQFVLLGYLQQRVLCAREAGHGIGDVAQLRCAFSPVRWWIYDMRHWQRGGAVTAHAVGVVAAGSFGFSLRSHSMITISPNA